MNQPTDFTYIRNGRHPIGGVAIQRQSDNQFKMVVSKCHPADLKVFDKKLSKNRAIGRVNSENYGKTFKVGDMDAVRAYLDEYHVSQDQKEAVIHFVQIHQTPKA